jgi:hypothetical protein
MTRHVGAAKRLFQKSPRGETKRISVAGKEGSPTRWIALGTPTTSRIEPKYGEEERRRPRPKAASIAREDF